MVFGFVWTIFGFLLSSLESRVNCAVVSGEEDSEPHLVCKRASAHGKHAISQEVLEASWFQFWGNTVLTEKGCCYGYSIRYMYLEFHHEAYKKNTIQ